MEELVLKLKSLLKAYDRLRYMVEKFSIALKNRDIPKQTITEEIAAEDNYILHRDALIKRFEFCYDLTWKYLKQYLQNRYLIEINSPKKVFQECFQQNLITGDETEEFLKMVEARNYTSHTYDEELAEEISLKIADYALLMEKIIKKISKPSENT